MRRVLASLTLIAGLLGSAPADAAIAFNWGNASNTSYNTGTSFNVGSTNAQGANGTFTSGDFLVMVVTVMANSATDPGVISTPTGWTQIDQVLSAGQWSGAMRTATFYKIAGGSETGSYSASWTNAAYGAGWVLMDYTGVNTSSPIDAHNLIANTGYSPTPTTTAISPSGSTDMLIAAFVSGSGTGAYPITASPPSGMTTRESSASGSVSSAAGTDVHGGSTAFRLLERPEQDRSPTPRPIRTSPR